MSKPIDDGGPVHPIPAKYELGGRIVTPANLGLSIRDWFAGQAMLQVDAGPNRPECYAEAARWCYEMADAMLKERSNGR